MGHICFRTGTPPKQKRQELVLFIISIFKSFRFKTSWVIPQLLVPMNGPRIDKDYGLTRYPTTTYGAILMICVEPVMLLVVSNIEFPIHYSGDKFFNVCLVYQAFLPNYTIQLLSSSFREYVDDGVNKSLPIPLSKLKSLILL